MAWDFSTEPEFEQQLDWMRAFVREEIWPLETVVRDSSRSALDRIYAPLQEQVKERGLWAAHLDAELGGQGFGQVKLGLMHEILGTSPFAPNAFGCQAPDSGNSEILALAGTPEQKDRFLHPLLAGDLKSAFSMTEPNTAGSDPTQLQTQAVQDGDDYVITGRKWFSSNASIADFLIVMAVTDPEARPHQRATMFIVPTDTPGVEILRDVPTMEHPQEEFGKLGGHAEIVYDDVRIPAANRLGGEGEGFLIAQQRLYPGPDPPLHALAGRGATGVRHALRARDLPLLPRQGARRAPDGAELDRRFGGADAGRATDDTARRMGHGHGGLRGGAQGDRADQVLRSGRPARRGRPRPAGARLTGLLDRPAAGGDVPLRARRALLRRARRGPPPVGGPPDPARLRASAGRAFRANTSRRAGPPPGRSSRRSWTRSRRTTEREM